MVKKNEWISTVCATQAPSFEKVQKILEEKGVKITPRDYIEACKYNNISPDIDDIYIKIVEGNVTIDDINLVLEDIASSVRDRIQRRVRKNPTSGHITHDGHQRLGSERMSARTNPKRKRDNDTQSHGRGNRGHDRSTKKQRRRSNSRNGGDAK